MKGVTSIILPWMMLLSTATCIAQTLNAESPRVVSTDSTFHIVFTADGRMNDFDWPRTDDFDVLWGPQYGSTSSTNIVKGKRATTHQETVTYVLRPRRTGTFTIAAASANVDKQEVSSGTLQIEVVAGKTVATTATRVSSSPHNSTIPQNTTLFVDDLSEQGLMLIGRFRDNDWQDRDRSVRVFETQNKTILCIGYTDDIGGNINLKYLAIEKPDWSAFEAKMAIVNEKFTKWTQIAHEENERGFRKKIPVDFGNMVGTLSMGFVNNYQESELYAIFEVDSKGECSLRLDSWGEYDESNSSFESQMHTPFFVFKSPAYFNVLYQLIKQDNLKRNIEIMRAKIATKKRAEDDRSAKYD